MINVRGIANSAIQLVNPDTDGVAKIEHGQYVDGTWEKSYKSISVKIQVQQLTQKDILYLNNLQAQGQIVSIYVKGYYNGVDRIEFKAADLFEFNGSVWKVIFVPEQWKTWCRVVVCKQDR